MTEQDTSPAEASQSAGASGTAAETDTAASGAPASACHQRLVDLARLLGRQAAREQLMNGAETGQDQTSEEQGGQDG